MIRTPLTKQQLKLLNILKKWKEDSPDFGASYEELVPLMGLKSKSGIARLVKALIARGRVQHLRYARRSIQVVEGNPTVIQALREEVKRLQGLLEQRA